MPFVPYLMKWRCESAFPAWKWRSVTLFSLRSAETDFGGDGRLVLRVDLHAGAYHAQVYQTRGRHPIRHAVDPDLGAAVGRVLYLLAAATVYDGERVPLSGWPL